MTNNDAPDIPPALTAEEWNLGYSSRALFVKFTREGIAGNPRLDIEVKQAPLSDVGDLAALIALANEALRRFDDPRAFTRDIVGDLRSAASNVKMIADQIDPTDAGVAGIVRARADRLEEFADALESMLPPTEAGAQ
jgi:methyl-accepting chemotaxis protein